MPSSPVNVGTGLTPTEKTVLNAIRGYARRQGLMPKLEEIAELMGVSKVAIWGHVRQLIRKGHLRKTPNVARGLQLVGRCPCCGHVN